jgi:type II secretion system (T2SS) protein M
MTARDRRIILVVAIAALVAAGWFLVLSPQHDQASQLSSQIATQRQQLNSALSDVATGLAAKREYPHDYATVARLGTAVPDDDGVASLLVQVQQAAQASDIDFRSLKVGGGSGGAAPAPPAPPTPAAATQASTATLPPGASVGAAGFPTMPFGFQFQGDFFHLDDFLGRLQRFLVVRNSAVDVSGRFMTLDGIALEAGPKGFPQIQAAVQATTYLLPQAQGLTNGATPSGPASSTSGGTVTPGGAPPSSIPAATAISPVK